MFICAVAQTETKKTRDDTTKVTPPEVTSMASFLKKK